MAFFLIGRGAHDDVRLLSGSLFATRQDAMAELSRLSAQPGYDAWDDEVFVADLDAGVPVLLCRPQAEVAAEVPAAEVQPADESEPAVSLVAEPMSTGVLPTGAPETKPPTSDAVATEAAGSVPEAMTAAAAEQSDLREALLRTTQHMASEGLEPPASAGLTPAPTEEATTEESLTPLEGAGGAETPDEVAPSASAAADLPSDNEGEVETPAWPWSDVDVARVADEAHPTAEVPDAEATAEPREEQVTAAGPGWSAPEPSDLPDEETAPESDFILDLEEIRPVQLESHEAALKAEAEATQATTLEAAPPAPEAPAAADTASQPDTSPSTTSLLTEYTCDDCVYVGTCPNRDQRLPKDCGSFQWR